MKKVSILIPVYNKEKYLEATLTSINSQVTQGLFEIELVIIDDCSTDNSVEVIKNFKFNPDTVKLVLTKTPQNSGPSVALNIGFEASTGEYIVPHDADDLITKLGVLKRFLALEESPDYDWVTGNELMMTFDGRFIPGMEYVKMHDWTNNTELQDLVLGKMLIPAQSLMIRRVVLESHRWDDELWASQDTWINYSLTVNGYKLKKIEDYVAVYRTPDPEGQNSSYKKAVKSGRMVEDYRKILAKLRDRLTTSQIEWFEKLISNSQAAHEKATSEATN